MVRRIALAAFAIGLAVDMARCAAADEVVSRRPPNLEVLSVPRWAEVDQSVARAMEWLATQQQSDGSFPTKSSGQPAVTALCVIAFLSCGHTPGLGPYGERLNRAVDFVIDSQRGDGLFTVDGTELPADAWNEGTHTATYNHSIAGLMLGEIYGQASGQQAERIQQAIERGLVYTRNLQRRPKHGAIDEWGWRYIKDVSSSSGDPGGTADMSVTAWHLMYLRSARNAGFDVPESHVKEALAFVRRCYQPETGAFSYALYANGRMPTRATTGAGVLSLFLSGQYDATIARQSGEWILAHPFDQFNHSLLHDGDRDFYSAYYCSQAAYQLGGRYWEEFYPQLADVLVRNQHPDGSWDPEFQDAVFGNSYSTALAVLSLTPPYQLLPIYQR